MRIMGDAYKAGLRDAEYVNDVGRCTEFITQTQEPHTYGRITDNRFLLWYEWTTRLLGMKDIRQANVRAIEIIRAIELEGKKATIRTCVLPLAQDFYNQGLRDWNEIPISRDLSAISEYHYPRWTRNGVKPRTNKQMYIEMQDFALERGKRVYGLPGNNYHTPRKFQRFSLAVWHGLMEKSERNFLLNEE